MTKPGQDPQAWLNKGDKDLRLAELSLAEGPNFSDMVCYHAQQCAEKYLKGYLVANQREFPPTHLLSQLVALCRQLDDRFVAIADPATELQEYATAVRYPSDEFGAPSLDAAQTALAQAMMIRDFVLARMRP
jgi:HEPN domain-containing protein